MSTDSLREVRRTALVAELKNLGVGVTDPFGLFDRLVDELLWVIYSPSHENRLPGVGIMILSHDFEAVCEHRDSSWHFDTVNATHDTPIRKLSDGVHSFVLIDGSGEKLLTIRPGISDELDLFSLRDDLLFHNDLHAHPDGDVLQECLLIRREDAIGAPDVTVLCREKIITLSGGRWRGKPYQYSVMKRLHDQIDPFPWNRNSEQTLRSLLRVAVHVLSPLKLGGTLVLLTLNDFGNLSVLFEEKKLAAKNAVQVTGLSLTKRHHQRPLVNLIGQHDGAVIVDPAGQVLWVGVWIRLSAGDMDVISIGGSRHLTGQCFSQNIQGLVVVVSSEGNASVFRAGSRLNVDTDTILEPIEPSSS